MMTVARANWLSFLIMAMDNMMQHIRVGIEGEVRRSKAAGKGDVDTRYGDEGYMRNP